MANKKINELVSRTPSLTDLMLVGDPSSGYSYKCTVNDIALQVEVAVAGNYVTLATAQTISGAKTFSNVLTLTSVANSSVDTDKFLVLTASNTVNYRTGAEVLSDIGGASASSISGTTNYVAKFTSSSAVGNSIIFDNGTNVGIGTSTPNNKFVISNSGAAGIEFNPVVGSISTYNRSTSAYSPMLNYSSTQIWYIDTTEKMRLEANGNFGINTSSPNEKLEVSGVVRVSRTTSASAYLNLTIENGVAGYDARGSIEQVFYTGALERMRIGLGGDITLSTIANATTDTDKFLVSDSGVIKYRTGAELLSDIGGASSSSISGTTNYIPKFTGTSSIGNSLLYETGNLIGFGTTSPQNYGNRTFTISSSNTTGVSALVVNNSDNTVRGHIYTSGSGNLLTVGSASNTPIQFVTNDTERMRLDASGNLGLGTSTIYGKFHINSNGAPASSGTMATGLTISNGTSGTAINIGTNDGGGYNYIQSSYVNNADVARPLTFFTGATEKMRLDASGNLGLGVTPSAWASYRTNFQFGTGGSLSASNEAAYPDLVELSGNYYLNTSGNPVYIGSTYAQRYRQYQGQHQWFNAPSGTAGNAISFTQAMTLDASGRLGIGTTSPSGKLEVAIGSGYMRLNRSGAGESDFSIDASGNAVYDVSLGAGQIFRTNGGSERMRITSGGNVGIGGTPTSFQNYRYLQVIGGSTTQGGVLRLTTSDNSYNSELFVDNTGTSLTSSDKLLIYAGGSERMRLTSTGELLINTTSDAGDYKLQVNGNAIISNVLTSGSTTSGNVNIKSLLIGTDGTETNYRWQYYLDVNDNLITYSRSYGDLIKMEYVSGAITFNNTIKTGAPSGGTAKPFKIGEVATVSPTSPNRTIRVEIDGTVYYIAAKTTND